MDAWIGDQPELDVLVLTSSYDMDALIENKDLIHFIQTTSKAADWMASNCSGAYLLAEAGLLNGKKATTWAGGENGLQKTIQQLMYSSTRILWLMMESSPQTAA